MRSVSQRQQAAAPRGMASGALAPEVGKVKKRVRKKFRVFSARSGVDRPLFYLILVLLVIGLIMLFSASYAYSYYYFDNSYHFITPQALFAILGLVFMGLISLFDYHHLHKFAFPLFFVTLGLLAAVKVLAGTSIAPILNGANRWLYIGPINFQPSEVAKFALVLIFAHLISINYHKMGTFRYGVLPYLIILLMIAGLILVENHVSATLIVLAIAAVMLFIGGVKLRWFAVAGGLAGAGILYLLLYSDKFSYALDRIKGWMDPFNPPTGVDTWQTQQSLMAIGSGQALGLGLGQSRQKYLYLPEPQNDFIFAIVCEELGFVGALVIILLFALLIWRGIVVSLNAQDKFGTMLGIGITAQVGIQVILNIMVVTNTIPNTGISLPFFSYGGTSLVILLCEMGVLLSVSRSSSLDKT